jgi:hypothetical protein
VLTHTMPEHRGEDGASESFGGRCGFLPDR